MNVKSPVRSRTRRPAKTPKLAASEAKVQHFVGIGASAGGLEALRSLFSALTPPPGMTFIVVQHLAPLHRSRLVELIGHSTTMRVKEVEDGEQPHPSIIYITPPNSDVFLEQGLLRLRKPQVKIGPKPSIVLTGSREPEIQEGVAAVEKAELLHKPVSFETLQAALQRIAEKRFGA